MTNSIGWTDLDLKAVNTVRALAADAVEKTGNGHPGTAISLAPVAYMLYQKKMRLDPSDDQWLGRDRFVLSCGHSSLTQYIQLYLSGYGLELEDLEAFRTFKSKTPGHPEAHHTKGVEVTTGPLGQGVGMAVGMAMASRRVRGLLDPDAPEGESPFDCHIYALASDGDMQEGVSNEASSIAGTQNLGNLTLIWDDNHISIEDETEIAFNEDVVGRYEALGWHTQRVSFIQEDGSYKEDIDALDAAIEEAKKVTDKPSFIALRTILAWPSPTKQNTGKAHGSALGAEEVAGLKEAIGFDPEKSFDVAPEVIEHTRGKAKERAAEARAEWQKKMEAWESANPERATLLERLRKEELPQGWTDALPSFEAGKAVATRSASGKILTALAPVLPELWGGSADLAGSNNTTMDGEPSFIPEERSTPTFQGNKYGRVLHFGIREFGMGTALNGISMFGLTLPYGGTFLTFSDYMRNAVRLAAIMNAPTTFVWTHDSIGLGEDGPTHQPVEHLAALRAIPDFSVVRPADANETAAAWKTIIEKRRPVGLILSRQNLSVPERGDGEASGDTLASTDGLAKGAYILAEAKSGTPQVILIATGSEVEIALEARNQLAAKNVEARVVSMPCLEWFKEQEEAYQEKVLPKSIKARVSIEAGVGLGWREIVGDAGQIISLEHYGESADAKVLYKEFGFTPEHVVSAAEKTIAATTA